jgi:oligopeptide/dipeptide ABC transporter ATP-binding protein
MTRKTETNAPKTLLSLKNVKKHFDISPPLLNRILEKKPVQYVKAVDGIDLDVPEGSTFSLVGESGCGKSTVARLVVGLYGASGGTIEFDGQDVTNEPAGQTAERRRRMQMIFQDPYASLNPRWKVADIIAEPFRSFGMKSSKAEIDAEVGRLLQLVGLNPKDGDKYPHEFSGGQRQRISIARAIASKPDFLVCDEPTSALDVSVQAQILNLMKDLQKELGLTYLFISHDLAVVYFMSDWIGVMYLGRLVEVGEAKRVYDNPQHPYTRLLLDTIPDITMTHRDREPVGGEVPNPIDPPSGCTFHPRCPFANDRCKSEAPALCAAGEGVRVSCHGIEEGRITHADLKAETIADLAVNKV